MASTTARIAAYKTLAYAHRPLSRREVADRAGYSKGPTIIQVLEDMVDAGDAWRAQHDYRGRPMFVYVLHDDVKRQVKADMARLENRVPRG